MALASVPRDLHESLVRLRRRPATHLAAAAILSLGIAATLSMAVLLNALVFAPLPAVREPARLVALQLTRDGTVHPGVPIAALGALANRAHTVDGLCGLSTGGLFRIEHHGVTALHVMSQLTPACAGVLGIHPVLGRFIGADDDPARGVSDVVVLSFDYWRAAFGADPAVIGQPLTVEGVPQTIVGVAPPDFKGIFAEYSSDIYLPINYRRLTPVDPRRGYSLSYLLGRLAPGATLEQAQQEFTALWPSVREATLPATYTASDVEAARRNTADVLSLATGMSNLRARFALPLTLLAILATALFVVACVNVAGLIAVDMTSRGLEFAVRSALGASRGRVRRQVAMEAAVVVLLALVCAAPLAVWLTRGIVALVWTGLVPLSLSFRPTPLLVGLLATLAGTAFVTMAVLPARVAVAAEGAFGSRGVIRARRAPWTRSLLAAQAAVTIALTFGATLLAHSLYRLEHVDLGFDAGHIAIARAVAVVNGYAGINAEAYYRDLVGHVSAIPGVTSAALSNVFPSPLVNLETAFALEGPAPAQATIDFETVTPGFFATTGVPLHAGRDFSDADTTASTPVVIVSDALAKALFPGRSAMGQRIRIGVDPQRASLEVVGIAGDMRVGDVRLPPRPIAFRTWGQEPSRRTTPLVLLRTAGDPAALLRPLEKTIASLGREYTTGAIALDNQIGQTMTQERALAGVSACFGALAMVLALAGLFAQLMFDVRRRTPELGVRVALGASARAIQSLVLREAAIVIGAGVIAGVPLAVAAGRVARAVLFEISPADPVALAGVAAAAVAAGIGIATIPARRAAAIDPVEAISRI